jgi:methanogenesis imperfect marker protein 11
VTFTDIDSTLLQQFRSRIAMDPTTHLFEHILYLPNQMASLGAAFPWIMQTQALIKDAMIEANKVVISVKEGKTSLECVPGLRPIVWKEISKEPDGVKLVIDGIGGAANTFLPMIFASAHKVEFDKKPLGAKGVKKDEVVTATAYYPLHHKVTIGIDDTDTSTKGDTYLTALNVGQQIEKELLGYFIKMGLTLNYPRNPFKTTNNASSAMVFLTDPPKTEELIETVIEKVHTASSSRDTGIAIMKGIDRPPPLLKYTARCKAGMLDVLDAEQAAAASGIELISFDQDRGKIGALASLGYVNDPLKAISPSLKYRILFRFGNLYVKARDRLRR